MKPASFVALKACSSMKPLKLTTEVSVLASEWKINQQSKIITIGSCFAEVLGGELINYKFPVLNNPLGTVFNPLTICKIIDLALDGKVPNPGLYFQNADQIWFHHDFHSSLWAHDQKSLEEKLIKKLGEIRSFLRSANVLVLTFGTAYAYRHKATNVLIGNCHKVPSDRFVKELLHPDQITIPFEQVIHKLRAFRRELQIIISVSPVRHTKDTLPLNQVSKSTLRLLCHRLSEKFKQIEYFPAYEIMMDELRDYRFYKEDLIHPNALAEAHIFRTFVEAYLDPTSIQFMKEWEGVRQLMEHRPQFGQTESQWKVLQVLKVKLNQLKEFIPVSEEIAEIDRRIQEFSGSN